MKPRSMATSLDAFSRPRDREHRAAALPEARPEHGRARRCSPAAMSRTRSRCRRCSGRCRAGTTGCRAGSSIRSRLAPEFPESRITRPFPFNAYYSHRGGAHRRSRLVPAGRVGARAGKKTVDAARALRAAAARRQITRHICVEGWSAIGKWSGVRFSDFLQRIGADTTAKYVGFKCADDYYTSIDMPTALHPQTLLTFWFGDEVLPRAIRFPDEAAHSDQARLQESQAHRRAVRDQRLSRRLLGRPGVQLV